MTSGGPKNVSFLKELSTGIRMVNIPGVLAERKGRQTYFFRLWSATIVGMNLYSLKEDVWISRKNIDQDKSCVIIGTNDEISTAVFECCNRGT